MSPATKLRRGDKKKSGQNKTRFLPMSALRSSPITPEMDFAPINSKVSLITENGTVPFVSEVFTIVPAHGCSSCNYLDASPSARAEDQSFTFFPEVPVRHHISFLQSAVTLGTNKGRESDSA